MSPRTRSVASGTGRRFLDLELVAAVLDVRVPLLLQWCSLRELARSPFSVACDGDPASIHSALPPHDQRQSRTIHQHLITERAYAAACPT